MKAGRKSGTPTTPKPHHGWGGALAWLERPLRFPWFDLVMAAGLAGLLYGLVRLAARWASPHRAAIEIDLSPWALPAYTLNSLWRGLLAYGLSLGFALIYGYWAAHDRRAARVLIPLLDILQSIPVLAFLPGLLLGLDAAFPRNNVGLELAAIVMIFTGQAWNMTFSFYHSLRAVPHDQQDAATLFRFDRWQRLRWVELPFATMGLVWNSMMSMAGGWFFLMISETYRLGDQDFRLPGIGSYMQVAVDQGRWDAMLWALLAMLLMIVALDQLLWRPVVVWAQKFRVEEGATATPMSSRLLNWLRRSRLIAQARRLLYRISPGKAWRRRPSVTGAKEAVADATTSNWLSLGPLVVVAIVLAVGAWQWFLLVDHLPLAVWTDTLAAGGLTLLRVIGATLVGTLWALPAGLAIGLSSRWSRLLQPVVQIAASFPAPMLFPMVLTGLHLVGIPLGFGAIVLMLMGTQWYILFNVIAGAMAIPADLREAGRSFQLTLSQRFTQIYVPAVFPYLVTGWVTAAGGAWNASIVAEYVMFHGEAQQTRGLGSMISHATSTRDFHLLACGVLVMAVMVVLCNRLIWRRLYDLAEQRYSLSK